jgi:hypothetical protein
MDSANSPAVPADQPAQVPQTSNDKIQIGPLDC